MIVIQILAAKEPTPEEIADYADRMSGTYGDWDIEDHEYLNPREVESQYSVVSQALDQAKRNEIREIIQRLRQMGSSGSR